jgi:uncharacterized protein YecE (DUF72 family)
MTGQLYIGTSGWKYAGWRDRFYPKGLPQRAELSYAAGCFNAVEINSSFYGLQRPTSYFRWSSETPDGFTFAVKGSRFITHLKKLRNIDAALANFFASGLLALGSKLGPVLWQLPPSMTFEPPTLDAFLSLLPRSTGEAAYLARRHDDRLKNRTWTGTNEDRPLRHCLEVRHDSYRDPRLYELLREQQVALVTADAAGRFPLLFEETADFNYVRLHGAQELYTSGYDEPALQEWATRIEHWRTAGRDVFVFFDNDVNARAPLDAIALGQILDRRASTLRKDRPQGDGTMSRR